MGNIFYLIPLLIDEENGENPEYTLFLGLTRPSGRQKAKIKRQKSLKLRVFPEYTPINCKYYLLHFAFYLLPLRSAPSCLRPWV
jgi:hypothetical protein